MIQKPIFNADNIILNASFDNKWDAIRACGQILVDQGYVSDEYVEDMLEREKVATVYIGNNVAIPHGIAKSEENIFYSGVSFIQVPNGISFEDKKAYVLFGIAGKNNLHLDILGKIASVCMDMDNIEKLRTTTDKTEICAILSPVE